MIISIGAGDARQKFTELLGRVGFGGDVAIVERSRKPMAALIPIQLYQQLVAEREARFEIIEKIRTAQKERLVEKVEQDVREAVQRVRERNSAGDS
ncbi:MAG: type II toxin-antitoxin system prevent-host-death family antitoxin [Chloroflexi bacterium]|nr:type II toxin-antitoxin system prevent-host-death family antitoxin [Chloroflexota bacterium]